MLNDLAAHGLATRPPIPVGAAPHYDVTLEGAAQKVVLGIKVADIRGEAAELRQKLLAVRAASALHRRASFARTVRLQWSRPLVEGFVVAAGRILEVWTVIAGQQERRGEESERAHPHGSR